MRSIKNLFNQNTIIYLNPQQSGCDFNSKIDTSEEQLKGKLSGLTT